MTTLNDIDILRAIAEHMQERYDRACRRIAALVIGGRNLADDRHLKLKYYLEYCRESAERTRMDLENAIEVQALAASVG